MRRWRVRPLPIPWVTIVNHVLDWDETAHTATWNATRAWATRLVTRLTVWAVLLPGFALAELALMRLTGRSPDVLRDVDGRVVALRVPQICARHRRGEIFPVARIPGFIQMLQVYVEQARPVLLGSKSRDSGYLLLDSRGEPLGLEALSCRLREHAEAMFGHPGVRVRQFRQVTLALFYHGLHVHPADLAQTFAYGRVSAGPFWRFRPNPRGEILARLGPAPRARSVDAVVRRLRAWLQRLATDFEAGRK